MSDTALKYDFYVARAMAVENGRRVFLTVSVRDNSVEEAIENIQFKYPDVVDIENVEITGYYL